MKTLKSKVAALALTTGVGIGVLGRTPVHAAAGPNGRRKDCHGVHAVSTCRDVRHGPGPVAQNFGASVQDVQATADILCGS